MYLFGTNVLFVCRQCKDSFQLIDYFIEHKKEMHSVEFRITNCIVFEDIIILNNTNNDDNGSSMLSTVTMENESEVSCPKKNHDHNVNVSAVEIGTALTNVDLDLSHGTQHNQHDLAADPFRPFPTSTLTWDCQNSGINNADTSYQDDGEDYDDYILPESHHDFETAASIQVSADVSFNSIAHKDEPEFKVFERDRELKLNTTALVNMNPFPQNPYVLLKKLSLKKIQNYSRLQDQQQQQQKTIIKVEVTPETDAQCQCILCLKKFSSEAEFEIHCRACILDSKNKKRYCSHCRKFFSGTRARNFHMIKVHGTEEEQRNLCKFKCNTCQKGYSSRILLAYHLESHKSKNEQLRPFKCDQDRCDASFSLKRDLARHQASHALTRSFQCPEPDCKKSYKLKFHLQDHLKNSHSDIVELFQCPESKCTSVFKYRNSWKKHFRMCHDGIKFEDVPESVIRLNTT